MKKIYILASVVLALTACDSNDDNLEPSSLETSISASIGQSLPTRASDSEWASGDRIGITTSVNGTMKHINVKYTTDGEKSLDGSVKFTGAPIYFYKPMVTTAYYPFYGTEGFVPGIITANTTVDQQTSENQPKIDFLWDQQTGIHVVDNKPEVHFNFTHKMSKLSLIFKNEEGNSGSDVSNIVSYRIDGLVLNGTFNTEDGVCAASNVAAQSLPVDLSDVTVTSGESLAPLIIFPQTPGIGNVTLHIYANELNDPDVLQYYKCTLDFDNGKILAGNHYQYTISVSKTGVSINKPSITNWTDEGKEANAGSSD